MALHGLGLAEDIEEDVRKLRAVSSVNAEIVAHIKQCEWIYSKVYTIRYDPDVQPVPRFLLAERTEKRPARDVVAWWRFKDLSKRSEELPLGKLLRFTHAGDLSNVSFCITDTQEVITELQRFGATEETRSAVREWLAFAEDIQVALGGLQAKLLLRTDEDGKAEQQACVDEYNSQLDELFERKGKITACGWREATGELSIVSELQTVATAIGSGEAIVDSVVSSGVHCFDFTVKFERAEQLCIGVTSLSGKTRLAYQMTSDAGRSVSAKPSRAYGKGISSRDTIKMVIDMEAKTLSFVHNGEELGVSHANLNLKNLRPFVRVQNAFGFVIKLYAPGKENKDAAPGKNKRKRISSAVEPASRRCKSTGKGEEQDIKGKSKLL